MSDSRFDKAVKALASGTSRRQMVKTLVGGAGAVAITALGLRQEASADPNFPKGHSCQHSFQCASNCCKGDVCKGRRRCNRG